MLVLTRKSHEQIQIGDNITITILRVKGGAVRVGVDAPRTVTVLRKELEGRPAKHGLTQIDSVATSVAVAAPTLHRRTAVKAASIFAGGKTKALDSCPAYNPRGSRLVRAASPLSVYLAAR